LFSFIHDEKAEEFDKEKALELEKPVDTVDTEMKETEVKENYEEKETEKKDEEKDVPSETTPLTDQETK
jgi:hypothetical protein